MALFRVREIIFTLSFITAGSAVSDAFTGSYLYSLQPELITDIIDSEDRLEDSRNIIEIINRIDFIYSDAAKNLQSGRQLKVFMDPAHGLMQDGQWQGGLATGRTGCTGLPEEFYSIKLSRALYSLLSGNKFIKTESTSDFTACLIGESDIYYDITFEETVKLAQESGAFIILSQHLNNVSPINKADGLINLEGFHVTLDSTGHDSLNYIKSRHSGFLTLYNRLDLSGFSASYSSILKKRLKSEGYKHNSWYQGNVPDSRFTYFTDYPVSLMFESGFISNPDEEKIFRDDLHIRRIAEAQYISFLETLKKIYGIDLSGSRPVFSHRETGKPLTMLKLSRIIVYYMKKADTLRAVEMIGRLKKKFSAEDHEEQMPFYNSLEQRLLKAEAHYEKALKAKSRKQFSLARREAKEALNAVGTSPLFSSYAEKYSVLLPASKPVKPLPLPDYPFLNNSDIEKTIILEICGEGDIEKALKIALSPDEHDMKILFNSLKIAEGKNRTEFSKGLYLVKLDKKKQVQKLCRTGPVRLDPVSFQNRKYLKNSYFHHGYREKSL